MSFCDILKPRKDVLTTVGVSSIVDIENLRDKGKRRLEAKPQEFLELTFAGSDVQHVLKHLHERFTCGHPTAGLFLFEGHKGSGKSHLLLLVHHLATNRDAARAWLSAHKLECDLPSDVVVITHKYTDFPLDALWTLVWQECGAPPHPNDAPPNLDEFRGVVAGKHVFLILDELERGIQGIADQARRTQNLNFLQMITEEASRCDNATVTVFASVYDALTEPGATLKRVPRIDVRFSDPADRMQIVRHRLFENAATCDQRSIERVVASFQNYWRAKGLSTSDEYGRQVAAAYPFTPELIDHIQEHARNQFQGTRGALGFLGALVRYCAKSRVLMTTADAALSQRDIVSMLSDLDPGQRLTACAISDLDGLRDQPFAERIVASILLATLAAAGKTRGQNKDTLARQVLQPGDDINEFDAALHAFHRLGAYFHEQEGVYYFDPEEKPYAKVEYKSLGVSASAALDKAFELWSAEVFGDRDAVIFRDGDQAKAAVKLLDARRVRFVLAPRRLRPEERRELYHGLSNRNLVVLLEPNAKDFDACANRDILKWAQNLIAALELQTTTNSPDRKRQFARIALENKDSITGTFKKAGLVFAAIHRFGQSPADDEVELEPLGGVSSHREAREKIQQQFYPVQLFEEHLRERLPALRGRRVKSIEQEYRETLGFPVPLFDTALRDALFNLCRQKTIGIRHERDEACGRKPSLSDAELSEATIDDPFQDPKLAQAPDLPLPPAGPTVPEAPDGNDDDEPGSATPLPPGLQHLTTPSARSVGELRQHVAVKLAGAGNPRIPKVTFCIVWERSNADLGSLPQGLRGTLSSLGDITVDLVITKRGEFSKADVERLAESLPSYPDADYRAEMDVRDENAHS
ncbi:hypothetical protein GX586_12180 [bacterium]|nr:hypothetical protein [bacterium]